MEVVDSINRFSFFHTQGTSLFFIANKENTVQSIDTTGGKSRRHKKLSTPPPIMVTIYI
jgi:hypothetical protein